MRALTDADADRHAAHVAEQGHTIVEDAFDAAFGTEVLDTLDAVIEQRGVTPADNGFEGRSTYRVYNLLVPGSHRDPEYPVYGQAYDTLAAEMPAGSVLLWHGG